MNEKQIKRKLEDDGYKLIDVARHMAKEFPITEGSAQTMLHELIAGRRWMPVYVAWLKDKYGVVVERPTWLRGIRERMRQAA
jgi:hypothetical protein